MSEELAVSFSLADASASCITSLLSSLVSFEMASELLWGGHVLSKIW